MSITWRGSESDYQDLIKTLSLYKSDIRNNTLMSLGCKGLVDWLLNTTSSNWLQQNIIETYLKEPSSILYEYWKELRDCLFISEETFSLWELSQHKKRFTRPTIQEVKSYCQERNNGIDPESFIDFYDSKGWVVGKSPMKDWKAAIRTWEKRYRPATNGFNMEAWINE